MLIAGTSALSRPVVGAIITAAVALVVAFVTAIFTLANAKRERRRTAMLDAYGAAIAWLEYLERVRACRSSEEESDLRRRRSDLRQRSALCEGAMWSENRTLGFLYDSFSRYIQDSVGPQIDAAWRSTPRERTAVTAVAESRGEVRDVFFHEIRASLSFNPWKRWALRHRYPERKRPLDKTLLEAITAAQTFNGRPGPG